MAYQLCYWEDPKGNGTQHELKHIRLKSINEAFPLSLEHNRPLETVLITVLRTDRQSYWEKEIWRKPGYNL
jgi:hypothetical protein